MAHCDTRRRVPHRHPGRPDIVCEMAAGDPEQSSPGAMVATAMRAVNAVPYLVDAAPGLRTALDLPITAPRFAFS